MNFDRLQPENEEGGAQKKTEKGGVGKWLGKQVAIATAVGATYFGAMGGVSQAQEQKPSPEGGKTNITHVEQAMESVSIVASLNGTSSEIVKEMLQDVLAKEFPNGIPASIGGKKVQLVFNLRIEDREKSEYGTVNAGATLRWEVKDSEGSILKRGAAVDVTGPAAFNVNSARTKAVTSALEKISPEIKKLFQ